MLHHMAQFRTQSAGVLPQKVLWR